MDHDNPDHNPVELIGEAITGFALVAFFFLVWAVV